MARFGRGGGVPPATPFTILLVGDDHAHSRPLAHFLRQTTALLTTSPTLPPTFTADVLLITTPAALDDDAWHRVAAFVNQGGGCLTFAPENHTPLPAFFGATSSTPGAAVEVRVLFTERADPLGARLPDAFYVNGRFQFLTPTADTTTVLYADWRFEHRPVLTTRRHGAGTAAVTTLRDTTRPALQRILYRLLLSLAGRSLTPPPLGVALLGYAPSVGRLHGAGSAATPGLALRAACDLNPTRLDAAGDIFPGITLTADADQLAADPDVDVVIIATPPNSHAPLAQKMLAAGKHVICEKPLALTVAETEAMRETAVQHNVHLSCHQNRRWDPDFRAIRHALADGLLGDLFYMETFVGGYGHPCGFWHSHDAVSGGTTYDWGAHYLDWMLALMPGTVEGVLATRQNRLWHDITNADRERIQLRYAGGAEAEFAHSDLAYIPKPKWYLVGTEGALVGHWRSVDAYEVDPVHYYQKHEIPASEMGADLIIKKRDARGQTYERTLPEPPRHPFPFHTNLADHLLLGEPLEVPVAHSARVVAILEAARRSAAHDGRLETVAI